MIPLGILGNRRGGGAAGAFELIETVISTGSSSTLTFTSLPAGYKHLQLRMVHRLSVSGAENLYIRFNGDTGTNYAAHRLYGTGSSVGSGAWTAQSGIRAAYTTSNAASSGIFTPTVIDILDPSNSTTNKTIRSFDGTNVSTGVALHSGLWISTAAVTSITVFNFGGNWATGSRFSLYGIKG